jgi:DNA primase
LSPSARADIVEIVGEHVQLQRAGKDFRALCPFHQEKTPSFYVVPAKDFYNCFGCGESGDVFRFLMKQLGLGFLDAVRHLAARVGVEIPEEQTDRTDEAHRALYEAIAVAADLYRRQLLDPTIGERARDYLRERGVSAEAAERFQLGYAPDGWQTLREGAHRHGIQDDVLLAAGLVKESDRGDEPYDRLRNRLVFPILDLKGRCIGFGGRTLGPSGDRVPKYLNSPETPIYHKSSNLYGLYWARNAIRREGSALVVEGFMDYVSLVAGGVDNVVAPLGTAMTAEQAALVSRYTRQAFLLYDSDMAGLRASFRSADDLLQAGVHPLIVSLPQGEDPDSIIRDRGQAGLRACLQGATDVVDRKLEILDERGFFGTAEGARKAIDGLLPTLRATVDTALRDIYIARVAERTGVRRETLEAQIRPDAAPAAERRRERSATTRSQAPPTVPAAPSRPRRSASGRAASGRSAPSTTPPKSLPPGLAGPRTLLLLLLRDETRISEAAALLQPEEITDPVDHEIFQALVNAGSTTLDSAALDRLSPAAQARLTTLRDDPQELSDGNRIFADAIKDIRAESLYRSLDEINEQISEARSRGDDTEEQRLIMKKHELARELNQLSSERLVRMRTRNVGADPRGPRPTRILPRPPG